MIKDRVEVEYYYNVDTRKAALNQEEIERFENGVCADSIAIYVKTYTKFTNKGKVSKTEASRYDWMNAEAERIHAHHEQIKADREADMARAIELKKIVDGSFKLGDEAPMDYDTLDGDFDDSMVPGFVTIKIKTSHSLWYQNAGSLNSASQYYTMVPKTVEKEARELQVIRHKHQYDDKFDFCATDYKKKIVRVADHDNGEW